MVSLQLKSVTICTAGHLSNQAVSNFRATALIVDEAGLITYAETLSILLRRAFGSDYFRSCALVGDPRQLRPVFTQRSMLLDQELNKRGMNLSGIEVVINLGATTVLLNVSASVRKLGCRQISQERFPLAEVWTLGSDSKSFL